MRFAVGLVRWNLALDSGVRQSALGGGRIGDVIDDVGSMLTKLNVVVFALPEPEPGAEDSVGRLSDASCASVRFGPNFVNCVEALRFLLAGLTSPVTLLDLAIGNDKPRSLPLLATPRPQVNAVLYPEQSLPCSRHWVQYGRRRSQLV